MDLMTGVNSQSVSNDIYAFNSMMPSSGGGEKTCHPNAISSSNNQQQLQPKRKMSPPLAMAARLLAESKLRSGSDPALLATSGGMPSKLPSKLTSQQENKKPFWERSLSRKGKSSLSTDVKSPEGSPKVGKTAVENMNALAN